MGEPGGDVVWELARRRWRPGLTRHQRGVAAAMLYGNSQPDDARGPVVGSVPLVPAAGEAFTPAELDARLDHYAARAAAGLPLFGDGPPDDPDPAKGACWGCGVKPAPRRGRNGRVTVPSVQWELQSMGWLFIPPPWPRYYGCVGKGETYCPGCAGMAVEAEHGRGGA